jgi:hypothetical protein
MSTGRQKQGLLCGVCVLLVAAGGTYWIRGTGDPVQAAAQADAAGRRIREAETEAPRGSQTTADSVISDEPADRPHRTPEDDDSSGRRVRSRIDEETRKSRLTPAA